MLNSVLVLVVIIIVLLEQLIFDYGKISRAKEMNLKK